jgi:indolepyruvate ferredoxin oxidoreductase
VEAAEKRAVPGSDAFAKAVARYAFKLMAIKDEYEVARLYTDGTFRKQLHDTFEGDFKLEFNLAPPLFAKRDPETGKLQKSVYGPWMLSAFGMLAKFKGLRGGALDIFGRTDERKMERRLRDEYIARMERLADGLSAQTHPVAVDLALVPEQIRGYGHVKEAHVERAEAKVKALEEQLRNPDAARKAAE